MMRASEQAEHYHPTQKPVALYEWVLGFRWIPNGTICDPYMGAGPCAVASVRTSRDFVGIELERLYWETAVRRVRAELERFPLFEQSEASLRQLELPG